MKLLILAALLSMPGKSTERGISLSFQLTHTASVSIDDDGTYLVFRTGHAPKEGNLPMPKRGIAGVRYAGITVLRGESWAIAQYLDVSNVEGGLARYQLPEDTVEPRQLATVALITEGE